MAGCRKALSRKTDVKVCQTMENKDLEELRRAFATVRNKAGASRRQGRADAGLQCDIREAGKTRRQKKSILVRLS